MGEFPLYFFIGLCVGGLAFSILVIIMFFNRYSIYTRIWDAPLSKEDFVAIRRAGVPLPFIVDAYVELTKLEYSSDISSLISLYRLHRLDLSSASDLRKLFVATYPQNKIDQER